MIGVAFTRARVANRKSINAIMTMKRPTIRIGGKRYRVREQNGCQSIEHEGRWMTKGEFVDHLKKANDWATLGDLVKIGFRVARGKLAFGSVQQTADEEAQRGKN